MKKKLLTANNERKLSFVWYGVKLNPQKNTKAITIMGNRSTVTLLLIFIKYKKGLCTANLNIHDILKESLECKHNSKWL